ncbi:glycoside hydrolase family protein [Paenibacillus mucilaginosus 3016]|uniref:Glycoside hydrolase family protein n=1 Tax=Paenibacillus mucilaginosus 3016 TaxID=1116391 RepID=H6NF49_9BACL|nr:glycoside hydrolase family 9 protein [Paenibacillus mucilaginosus]AFC29056.1 glycoside hydrolase family protein [Paenibacillus mucilaginosus 3016]WFA17797.1 glycoside hydrolase [Paenibacillus mucilaginosus]
MFTGGKLRVRKKWFPMILALTMACSMLPQPVSVHASETNPYLPPEGPEWNKLRDLNIDSYAWGYGSTVTSVSYAGRQAFRHDVTGSWASQFIMNGWQTFNLAPYDENGTLEFDIIGQAGGEQVQIGFQDVVHERRVNGAFFTDSDAQPEETRQDALSQDMNSYVPVTREWQHVSIPLKTITGSNALFEKKQVQLLKLTGTSSSPSTFWISNIRIVSPDKEASAMPIKVNQVGYTPGSDKYALVSGYYNEVSAGPGTPFQVRRQSDDSIAYSGQLSLVKAYDALSGEKVLKADFTPLKETGSFYVTVNEVAVPSVPFEINSGVYGGLLKDVTKFFYYQRANADLQAAHAGEYARTGAHKQDAALPLQSSSITRDVSGGWWDAGDTGKYVTAGATAVSDLLWAYETFPKQFRDGQLNIPESGNGVPDLLDEIKFETDFFLKMQDPVSGGFYAYVNREPVPNRYIMDGTGSASVIPTAQTANTVGALAHAAVVFKGVPGQSAYAAKLLAAAVRGWNFLEVNPQYIAQPDGPYNDQEDLNDRFYAAAVLYRATGEQKYNAYVQAHYQAFASKFSTADFSHGINGMEMIGYYHYLKSNMPDAAVKAWFTQQFTAWRAKVIDTTLNTAVWRNSTNEGFYWGANSNVASVPMSLAIGSMITGQYNAENLKVASGNLHYLLGINPLQLSYITGHGENRIHRTHHEIFMRDFKVEMPGGYMVGGPNNGKAKFPAKAYNHSTVDWETNEQALNYNSPLVFLTAMMLAAEQPEKVYVSSITLNKTTETLKLRSQSTVTASVGPETAENKRVTVKSKNPNVAKVAYAVYDASTGQTSFTVSAVGIGSTQIVVTSQDGKASALYNISVTRK